MMNNVETVPEKTSKYNAAFAQLERIGDLWTLCHKFSRGGNFPDWNAALDKVWAELAGDISEKDPRNGEFMEFFKKLSEIGNMKQVASIGFALPDKTYQETRSKHYIVLLDKEIWLRRLQNKLGKGTKWDDDEEDDFN